MKKTLTSFLVFGILALSATSAPAKVAREHLIVPGRSVGAVRLSMLRSNVVHLLGAPSFSQKVAQDFAIAMWEKQGLFIGFDGDGHASKVVLISVSSPRFETENGAKVGLKASRLKRLYPKGTPMPPSRNIADWHDDRLGIGFVHRTYGSNPIRPHEDWACDEINVFAASRLVNTEKKP
ncbi:MAG: hypothetical protein ACM3YO_01955 [Bacteroidota bacterium]